MAMDSDTHRRKNAPDARADTILSILSSIFTSVELVCLADGKAFTHPRNTKRAEDSFYCPLICIQEIFLSLKEDLDRWAKPAKFLEYKNGVLSKDAVAIFPIEVPSDRQQLIRPIARVCRSEDISDHEKMQKLYRTLDKIGRIDDNYVSIFTRFAEDLDPVRQEFRKLINLLKEILQDGDSLDPDTAIPRAPGSLRDITNEQNGPRHRRGSPRTCLGQDTDELLSHHLTETVLLTPPSEPDLAPHWKHVLSDWHPIDDLYVGSAELFVFIETLHRAKKCAALVKSTQELASRLAVRAEEQQVVWEDWWEVWHGWNNEKKRRERDEEAEY